MKWLPFGILAGLTIVAQTTIVPRMAIEGVWPDWMFVLAVHYALWGAWPEAAIGAWVLGLIVDLQSVDQTGLHAFCYGASAWAIIRIRQVVFRDHPVTQLVLTLVFALGVQLVVAIFRNWRASLFSPLSELWWPVFLTACYTAVWAPVLHWLFIRLRGWTGLRSGRSFSSGR